MLNDYANRALRDEIKNELNEKEIEKINSIDLKAGYYWLGKCTSILFAAILLILCVIFDSKTILAIVIALVSIAFFFNWRESHWMDVQDNYLTDLSIYIGLELKLREDKFNNKSIKRIKKYKYLGGLMHFVRYTVDKEYESLELEGDIDCVNIIDDYWIEKGYKIEKCILENINCALPKEEVERCFVLIEE